MKHQFTHLKDRGLLALSGPDARTFLQGMVTCNVLKLTPTTMLYGAHLTQKGRLLYDFFLFELSDQLVLECHKETLLNLAKSLHTYQLRFNVMYEDLSEDYIITHTLTPPQKTNTLKTFADPRGAFMGYRTLFKRQDAPINPAPLSTYHQYRTTQGVPEVAYDALFAKTIAGEFGLEFLNGVDYQKGCYIGQEMTARTHFRTAPKKRPILFTYPAENPPHHGAIVSAGKLEIGHAFSVYNGVGIAIVRVAKAFGPTPLNVQGTPIAPQKPSWAHYSLE